MNDGEEERRPLRSSAAPHRRGDDETTTGRSSRNIALLLLISLICFLSTFLTYQQILSPYVEGMSSINQPLLSVDINDIVLSNKSAVDDKQLLFQPTEFHKHIIKSTYETGGINSNVRISFQLHDFGPINNKLWERTCPVGMNPTFYRTGRSPIKLRVDPDEVRSGILPPSLTRVTQSNEYPREGRVLDFTATISTNLKILHIGDSVGVQLAQGFDEMVGCRNKPDRSCRPRDSYSAPLVGITHDSHSVQSTIGGGVSALWR